MIEAPPWLKVGNVIENVPLLFRLPDAFVNVAVMSNVTLPVAANGDIAVVSEGAWRYVDSCIEVIELKCPGVVHISVDDFDSAVCLSINLPCCGV